MRLQNRRYMVDGRKTHHDVEDRNIGTTKNGAKKIDPKAGERKMQTTNDNKEQR